MAQHCKHLIAWQKVVEIYRTTDQFPKREVYSLTDQMRRAAVSIPSNIAEGQSHYSKREFTHFLRPSPGSLAELETQVRISLRLNDLPQDEADALLQRTDELGRILSGLIHSLKDKA